MSVKGMTVEDLGAAFVMFGMAFAKESVASVDREVQNLRKLGQFITRARVAKLAEVIQQLPPADRGKRDGRASQFTGANFLQALSANATVWRSARAVFANMGGFLSVEEAPSFVVVFREMRLLPLIGKYFACRLVRLLALTRRQPGMSCIAIDEEAWALNRNMGGGPAKGFVALGVRTYAQVTCMLSVVRRF